MSEDDPWDSVKALKEALDSGKITPQAYQRAMVVLTQPHAIGYGLYRRFIKKRPTINKADRVDLYCHG